MPYKFNPISGTFDKVNPSIPPAALQYTSYTGANCTGESGQTNRTLTPSFTPALIVVEGQPLHSNEFSLIGNQITFSIAIGNDFRITVYG